MCFAQVLVGVFVVSLICVEAAPRRGADGETAVTVATYNLWNVMFNWDVRKFRIAQMIKEANPDIIGFQEVRAHKSVPGNQVLELQQLLLQYPWHAFEVAHEASFPKDSYVQGFELEGVGLLSKYPISRSAAQNLTYHSGPDTNRRVALHADVIIGEISIHVTVLHLSYDRYQQCSNSAEVLKYLHMKQSSKDVIILGDFNAYPDFDWPVSLLLEQDESSKCAKYVKAIGIRQHFFVDAWKTMYPDKPGMTFSNMPTPGMESRPDRILISTSFHVTAGLLLGSGAEYKRRFSVHMMWKRLSSVVGTAHDSWSGYSGRSCWHDCGPHSSCRCGVCISGGDDHACMLPDCTECDASVFKSFLICVFIFCLLLAQLVYAMLMFLQTMNDRGRYEEVPRCFGVNCCLLDTRLYTRITPSSRRNKCHRLHLIWPILRLPPVVMLVVTVLLCVLFMEVMSHIFRDAIRDVNDVIPEEMFPSDHLLLSVKLQKRNYG